MDPNKQNQSPEPTPSTNWQYQSGNLSPNGNFQNQSPAQPIVTGDMSTSQPEMAPGMGQPAETTHNTDEALLAWSSAEFVVHEKNARWYALLNLAAIGLAALTYILTKDIISVSLITVTVVIIIFAVKMKPRTLNYAIGNDGIMVGNRLFNFHELKSFAVMGGQNPYIMLLPQKKFGIPLNIYFDAGREETIVNLLGQHIPYEHKEPDIVDRLSSRLRF